MKGKGRRRGGREWVWDLGREGGGRVKKNKGMKRRGIWLVLTITLFLYCLEEQEFN